MRFGTATDEATSFAILDRYVEAGGTFIDRPAGPAHPGRHAGRAGGLTAEQRARLDAAR
jgi:hypothetical protein